MEIYILWLRQIKRYLRSKSRIIGSLGQPLLFLLALGYGLGPIFQRAGEGSYIEFLAPGIIAMSILFTSIFSGIEIIWDRQFGFLKEIMVAPVPRFTIMIGRTFGGATVATIQGMIVFLISLVVGFRANKYFGIAGGCFSHGVILQSLDQARVGPGFLQGADALPHAWRRRLTQKRPGFVPHLGVLGLDQALDSRARNSTRQPEENRVRAGRGRSLFGPQRACRQHN